ncbi:MAG: acetate--CoA ligase family protein [Candidatus Dojkabacteria bacterium]|nr:acetate--CoA ligase family protein [Candidatus Dojkabacteria bacterium]
MIRDLNSLFYPKKIAIYGVSRDENALGNSILRNIIESGYKGKIYPIHKELETIYSLSVYKNIKDINDTLDLVLISVKADFVLDILQQCVSFGVKNFCIYSAGFGEMGDSGDEREKILQEFADRHQLNILGPNCLGFVNNDIKLNATFALANNRTGNLRFITQSGAIASSFFDWATHNKIHFSHFVTLGNKTVLNEVDILRYFDSIDRDEANTDTELASVCPIGLYLESINNGVDFVDITSKISLKHPIFLLKPGRSTTAQKAISSHTGSMANDDRVLDTAIRESGILRCDGIEDFFDLAKAFAWEDAPLGPNVVVLTNAGGPAVVLSDAIEQNGLKLVYIDDKNKHRLQSILPPSASINNPIDVLGDAPALRYIEALDIVLSQSNVHAAILVLTPQIMTEISKTAEMIARIASIHRKTVICSFMGSSQIVNGEEILNMHKIPNFRYPERAAKVLGIMYRWRQYVIDALHEMKSPILFTDESVPNDGVLLLFDNLKNKYTTHHNRQINLSNYEVNEIFTLHNINVPASRVVTSFDECLDFVNTNGFPVVMKIISRNLVHKFDVGGVITGINTQRKLKKSFDKMNNNIKSLNLTEASIQIQKQCQKGVELIVGLKRDRSFGDLILFGMGGTYAELISDINMALLPLDYHKIKSLVHSSRVFRLLSGYRNGEVYDLEPLYDFLFRFSQLLELYPQIQEIEVNPLIVNTNGIWAVDGKAVLST